MLLSIIIPVYNLEKYIEKCINSIIKQITDDIEIVIINDGSKDQSESLCKKYEQQYTNIKYIYQNNSGVSAARNNRA